MDMVSDTNARAFLDTVLDENTNADVFTPHGNTLQKVIICWKYIFQISDLSLRLRVLFVEDTNMSDMDTAGDTNARAFLDSILDEQSPPSS